MVSIANHPNDTSPDQGFEKLFNDFADLFRIKDPLRQDYEVIERARDYEQAFGLPADEYRRLFKNYCQAQQTPDWFEPVQKILQRILTAFQGLAFLTIAIAVLQFVLSMSDREVASIAESWKVLSRKEDPPHSIHTLQADAGRKKAIEYLHQKGEDLSNLPMYGVVLNKLRLPGRAELQNADFRGAKLYEAYFSGANLYDADFSPLTNGSTSYATEMNSVNLSKATLEYANFQMAGLTAATFESADLEYANFNEAHLEYACFVNADLGGASFLDAPSKGVELEKLLVGADFSGANFGTEGSPLGASLPAKVFDEQGNSIPLERWLKEHASVLDQPVPNGVKHGCEGSSAFNLPF